MRYRTPYRFRSTFFSGFLPKGVKWLLIANTAVFLLTLLAVHDVRAFFGWFALSPWGVLRQLKIWQLGTYLFLHGGFFHLLFNMLTLWMFGTTLESDWGTRRFLKYYFFCGVGAGLCDIVLNAAMGNWGSTTIGASGAIYGLLLAFGVMYPEQRILMDFLFPIKAKYMVMIYGAIALLSALSVNSGVSNIAHLGGMLFGYAYLKMRFRMPAVDDLRRQYRQWKIERAKRKFQVYMRKHSSRRDPWTH